MSIYGDLLNDDDDETAADAGLPDPVNTIAGPSTKNQAVYDRIQQVRQGTGSDPAATPPPEPTSSPYSPSDLAAMEYAHGAQQDASIGRALNAVASGFGAKVDNGGYDSMVNNANTTANKTMDRSSKVAQAVAARTLKEKAMADAESKFGRQQTETERHNRAVEDAIRAKSTAKENQPTKGQQVADATFAKDAADYYYGGGKASTEKNLTRLSDAIDKLKENPNLTGGTSTSIPILSSDKAQDVINPEMAAVRDEIRGAIQASLRQVLGAQFTAQEGEAIFNRAFNPRLSADENVKRATQELTALKNMAAQKDASMQQFLDKGTLKGYSPSGTKLPKTDTASGYPKQVKKGTQVATVSSPEEEKEAKSEGFM